MKQFPTPKYTDDEVGTFHPICEYALNKALENLGLQKDYSVVHHFAIGQIIPDFVIINKHTSKILLIIEVKRTHSQVTSTKYKDQARSYVLEAGIDSLESPYYILTNLELINFFKNDTKRTSVNKQILSPSPLESGNFDSSFSLKKLIDNFTECISIAKANSGRFLWGYEDIVEILERYHLDFNDWHTAFTVVGYEFIKAILDKNEKLPNPLSWKSASYYKHNPNILLNNIKKVNFTTLTGSNILKNNAVWNQEFLDGITDMAKRSNNADELTSAIHEYLVRNQSHLGVVPTDYELAFSLSVLTIDKDSFSPTKLICDPAAGGGNLIAALIDYIPQIKPEQIKANDILVNLSHLLSLRLGLRFANSISPYNSPQVSNCDIVDLPENYFDEIDYILLNPPYLSGVTDKKNKEKIFEKLENTFKIVPITKTGQMPLEGPFLEYLIENINPGTVIGVIIPKSHLFGKGKESTAIRTLLIKKFGLKKIFLYPREDLFKNVSKETVILVGEKGIKNKRVTLIQTNNKISDINMNELSSMKPSNKFSVSDLSLKDLESNVSDGWRSLLSDFDVIKEISQVIPTSNSFPDLYRGKAGNSGATEYLFISKHPSWKTLEKKIPSTWLKPAIENTNDIADGDKYLKTVNLRCLTPPQAAFTSGTSENVKLDNIIREIQKCTPHNANNKQVKNLKTISEIKKILEKDSSKIVPKGSLIIPRNLRRTFKAYITTTPMVVSTNFFVIENKSVNDIELIYSWLLSVFGQIQLETFSKLQEGARKSEKNAFISIKLPNVSSFPVCNEASREFYDYGFHNTIDKEWAKILNISTDKIEEFNTALYELIMQRNP